MAVEIVTGRKAFRSGAAMLVAVVRLSVLEAMLAALC